MGILEDVVINAKSAANAVGKSATKLYDLSKLKVSAADLNGDINKHFEALGRIVYDGKQNGEDNSALIEDSVKIIKDLYESLAAINQQNARFRFVKFVIDTNDHTVQAEADVAFRSHDVGDICLEYVSRCINICDDAYPELMKALWG